MIAIVLEPPAFFPNSDRMFSMSCIGMVKEATDCLNNIPSWFKALPGKFAIRLRCRASLPIAVE